MSDLLDFSPPGQTSYSLSGAKARFYNSGTTTPRTVYTGQAEAVAHPVPLVADANGVFPQVFVSGGAVKVVVTKSDDSTGYTLDPCVKTAASGSAASLISFSPTVDIPETNAQAAIERVQTNLNANTPTATGTLANGTAGQIVAMNDAGSAPAYRPALTQMTSQASTSGTSRDFTGIPAWARRITIMLVGVSLSGTANILIQVGDSGGPETTGYNGTGLTGSVSVAISALSNGFLIYDNARAAGDLTHGKLVLDRIEGADTWVADGQFSHSNTAEMQTVSGSKTLSATLDRVRITTTNGTDTFDAGTIGVTYE